MDLALFSSQHNDNDGEETPERVEKLDHVENVYKEEEEGSEYQPSHDHESDFDFLNNVGETDEDDSDGDQRLAKRRKTCPVSQWGL